MFKKPFWTSTCRFESRCWKNTSGAVKSFSRKTRNFVILIFETYFSCKILIWVSISELVLCQFYEPSVFLKHQKKPGNIKKTWNYFFGTFFDKKLFWTRCRQRWQPGQKQPKLQKLQVFVKFGHFALPDSRIADLTIKPTSFLQ